ncbi:uncharacterized protein V6R79_011402 [Siganus canaliculatus]
MRADISSNFVFVRVDERLRSGEVARFKCISKEKPNGFRDDGRVSCRFPTTEILCSPQRLWMAALLSEQGTKKKRRPFAYPFCLFFDAPLSQQQNWKSNVLVTALIVLCQNWAKLCVKQLLAQTRNLNTPVAVNRLSIRKTSFCLFTSSNDSRVPGKSNNVKAKKSVLSFFLFFFFPPRSYFDSFRELSVHDA